MGSLEPTEKNVIDFLHEFAVRARAKQKFPLWTIEDTVSEGWLLWVKIRDNYGETLDHRWRGLLTTTMQRRLPEIYQKSLGKKCRRGADHSRTYFSDAQLLDPPPEGFVQTEVEPDDVFVCMASCVIQWMFLENSLNGFEP